MEGFRWNKICRREILVKNGIKLETEFPADIPFSYEILSKIDSCVMVGNPTYYYRQHSDSKVAHVNLANAEGMLNIHRKIANIAAEQGIVKEALFFKVYRAINDMYGNWKCRDKYKFQEWDILRIRYRWKEFVGMLFLEALKVLKQYPILKDGTSRLHLKH